jgi:DUF1680 family protein
MRAFVLQLTTLLLASMSLTAQSYVPEYANKKEKVTPVVAVQANPFDIRDVRLLDGPFKQAMEADARYLLVLEPDRLLSEFRTHAGLPPRAPKYGGWESSGLAGHTLGHYLSACSMQYASTGDTVFRNRVAYIVDELWACQQARKKTPPPGLISMAGYIGAIPREDSLWSEVAAGKIRSHGFDLNGAWSPWYTVHKVMAGLLDAWLYCDNARALAIEKEMAAWTATIVGQLDDSTLQKMLGCEYGGMNDVLANTYALTGDKKWLELSYRFHDKRILDSLSLGLDDLAGKHSNTQIPKIIGCARRYELTADKRDSAIATSFWGIIVNDHTYATGGNSDYEYLGKAGRLNDELTDNTTETCNTYNMLKLTRHLFAWHPSARLMDYYERALYNHILASQEHTTGMTTYFVPLRMGGHKEYSDSFNTFTCCVGSGMENHVKYGETIYSRGTDGSLYVNLFIPSRLTWKEKNITIEQQTQLPAADKIALTITTSASAARHDGAVTQAPAHANANVFTLRIRKPHWSGPIHLTINGIPQSPTTGVDGYLFIRRAWQNGDKIIIQLPENFYTETISDNPNRIALFYGPILLAGELGDKEPDPVKGIPVLVSASVDPNQWIIRKSADPLVFQTTNAGQPGDLTLIPFNRTANEYYSVYWDYFTPSTWAEQQDKYAAERRKEQELEDHTIDRLRLGEMQPERDHAFSGVALQNGEGHGKKWRATDDGGSFSFTMKCDSSAGNSLLCDYWGDDHRGRIFDIQIDGQTIATQNLTAFKQSKFYEITYPIPQELVSGKSSIIVRFAAHNAQTSVGPVSGTIRMIRN